LGQFLVECCETGPELSELFADLYEAYQIWADDSGVEAETTTTFGKMLGDRGYPSRKVTKGPNRKKAEREGLRLRPSDRSTTPKSDEASIESSTKREATSAKCVLPPVAPGLPVTRVARAHRESNRNTGGNRGQLAAATAFDLETAGLELWSYGPRFVRLTGWRNPQGEIKVSTDPARLPTTGVTLVGHNIWCFDLPALARYHGLDLTTVEAYDTKLAAFLADPPAAKMNEGQIERYYSLDAVGERLLGVTKAGDIKAMAKKHGGFDQIPLDDPEYVAYLRRDVELTGDLVAVLPDTPYVRRENEIARITAVMSLTGFRVDEGLLATRLEKAIATRERMLGRLKELGLPTTRKDGSECKAPHSTEEGKAAIVAAFAEFDVELPLTAKGHPALDQKAMDLVAERHPKARRLAETVKSLNGVRSVYETTSANLVDGRVHPQISLRQATGRWSVTKPGMTVFGKRGGRHIEREIFIADEGEIMIAADLSQVDARAVAALSGDPAYLALFEPGIDAHAEVAQMVWGDRSRREDAKLAAHGWNYGLGVEGLARRAAVSIDTAHQFDQAMRERFPDLVRWRMKVRQQARAGELLDNGFGRKMRPDPERAHTQGPALMGQGCARDILMEGLLRLDRSVWPMLRAVIHDEIVLSVPADIVGDVEREVVRALSFSWCPPSRTQPVQIVAGLVGRGQSWGQVYAKEVKAA
jgi:DNA polymerase-1